MTGNDSQPGPPEKSGNFMVQLLEHDYHNNQNRFPFQQHQGQQRKAPSHFTIWASALKHMKFSKAFDGIQLTNNTGMLCMFLFFLTWLFVVYTIRHHDPFAKQIIVKTGKVLSLHRQLDDRVVSGVKTALPVRMTQESGTIFVPGANTTVSVSEQQGLQVNDTSPPSSSGLPAAYSPYTYPSSTYPSTAYSSNQSSTEGGAAYAADSGPFVDPRFGSPLGQLSGTHITSSNTALPEPIYPSVSFDNGPLAAPPLPQRPVFLEGSLPPLPTQAQPQSLVTLGRSNDGSRLKMFVSR